MNTLKPANVCLKESTAISLVICPGATQQNMHQPTMADL